MAKNGMIPAVVAGVIVAAVIIGGCEKKSDADAGAKKEAAPPAAAETKPAPAPAAQPAAPQAADAGAKPEAAPPAEAKPAEAPKPAATPAAAGAETASTPFDPAHPYHRYDDGKWDFRTYRGYNMYHSVCHVCHGANANGSSFAPALKESLKTLTYEDFVTTVMNGRVNITPGTTNVMPPFGENPSVVKYIDSLYAYIKARSTGDLGTEEVQWEGPRYDP